MPIPNQNLTWDLSPLFKDDHDPRVELEQKEIEQVTQVFVDKWQARTDYLENVIVLKEALDEYEALHRQYGTDGDSGYYIFLRSSQDQNDPVLKAKYNKVLEFSKKIQNLLTFFELKLAKITSQKQAEFLQDESLKVYHHFLERLFAQSKHLLTEAEEKIVTLKSGPAYHQWVKMTSSFLAQEERSITDENGKKIKLSVGSLLSYLNHKTKTIRDDANKQFNAILKSHADVATEELNAILGNKKIDDQLRTFSRADQSRHLGDDIDTEVVDVLLQTVAARYTIPQRFYQLKARLLDLKKLEYHERNIAFGSVDQPYSFDQAVSLAQKVFGNLDPEFLSIFNTFVTKGHIDVYPRKGKTNGAFCAYGLIRQPVYILLNYTDKLTDCLVLAHEVGHGINDEMMRQHQHALNFGTPVSTAEVASTFMEDFVTQEIIKEADNELKLSLMMMKLNEEISTIFRQVACYTFEQELHLTYRETGYVSKEKIGEIFHKHMATYMGDAVIQSPGSENWWVYWNHIRSFFYVYSYASGALISKALQREVKKQPEFIQKVKLFLSTGTAESPKDIFAKLNIDITDRAFWDEGLDEIEQLVTDTEKMATVFLESGKESTKESRSSKESKQKPKAKKRS